MWAQRSTRSSTLPLGRAKRGSVGNTKFAPAGDGKEVELKLRVERLSDLMRIANAAGGTVFATVVQTNHFFDTADRRLDRARIVLRLREERDARQRWFVTLKDGSQRSADRLVTTANEEEVEVDGFAAQRFLLGTSPLGAFANAGARAADAVARVDAAAAGSALVCVGAFINERTCVEPSATEHPLLQRVLLELDRTTFPGNQIHHELEVELAANANAAAVFGAVHALLARAGVTGLPSSGKARRFFAAQRGEAI